MARRETKPFALLLLILFLSSCGTEVNQALTSVPLTTHELVLKLFETKCNTCHPAAAYVADPTKGCAGGMGSFENRPLGKLILGSPFVPPPESGCPDRTLMERLIELPSLNCPEEALIVPGDSSKGLLMKKIRSTTGSPTFCDDGTPIPELKGVATPEDLKLLEKWIDEMS